MPLVLERDTFRRISRSCTLWKGLVSQEVRITPKGKDRPLSTDTPRKGILALIQSGQVPSVWLCIRLDLFSNLTHWSSIHTLPTTWSPPKNRNKNSLQMWLSWWKARKFLVRKYCQSFLTPSELTMLEKKTFMSVNRMNISSWGIQSSVKWLRDPRDKPTGLKLHPFLILMKQRFRISVSEASRNISSQISSGSRKL